MSTRRRASVVAVHPDVMCGAPVFSGTRVPIATLFDSLAEGETVAYFLEGFPQVSAEQVSDVLREAGYMFLAKHGATPT